ncbi:MAG: Rieske 2Fe-2S domain-containing protein [Acidimicrobiales bacterium]
MSTSPSPETTSSKERRLPFNAPVHAGALSEWALVPLRLFLGVTFLFAGLQKLANPGFFNEKSPSSIQAQLTGAARVSPLHALLSHLLSYAVPIGITIAIAEVAIGLGTLLGLWSRIAAVGGALVSLSLFFTVSFHSSPYYTGSDIVFLFAWMPLIISGPGARLSMDGRIAAQAAASQRAPSPELVAIPFAQVQALCGHFNKSMCAARNNEPCDQAVCPVLVASGDEDASGERTDAVHRRTVIVRSATTSVVAVSAALFAAGTTEIGKSIAGTPTASGVNELGAASVTTSPGQSASAGSAQNLGTLLGAAKDVAIGRPAVFTIPSSGDPGIVIELAKGQYVGFDTVCPHMGCTVQYSPSNNMLVCPCHHSEFYANNGDVIQGPAPHGLTKLDIVEGSDSNLYLR